jgi:Predicted membrane protein
VASVVRCDASLVDRMWPVFIAGGAVAYWRGAEDTTARAATMLVLVIAWAVRLGVYIARRNWGHGEDRRYRAIRARNEPHFAWKSLYLVFALQALLAWIVAAPVYVGLTGSRPFGALDVAGAAVAAFGIVFEAIADAQMSRFKADPAHCGQVMDHGLWRYTRHPNYFGEACVWWGLSAMALGAAGLAGAWALVSPLLMTVLLLKVSGVTLLEKDIGERRPAYRDYVATTPAFIPGLPRRAR